MFLEVIVLYLLCITSVDEFVSYPANQFLSTPWSIMCDTLVMVLVIPMTFLSMRSLGFSVLGIAVLIAILVMNYWILCGDDMGMDSDADILTSDIQTY